MPHNVIIGFNGSPAAQDALAFGRILAAALGDEVLAANVFPYEQTHTTGDYLRIVRSQAEAELTSVPEGIERRAIGSHSPARGLTELAEDENASAVVLGSTHRSAIGRVLMGTVAERLLQGAPCSVAVAPGGYADHPNGAIRVIGVAYDASPEARQALRSATVLAERLGATLRVLGVAEMPASFGASINAGFPDLRESVLQELGQELGNAVASLPDSVRAEARMLDGEPAEALAEAAGDGVDLLVSGSRGYGPLGRVLLGSVSSRLMRLAPCPVLMLARGIELVFDGAGDAGPGAEPDESLA